VDVLRLLNRLDEDLLWVSAYQHATLLPQVVSAVEGFCSRRPPRQALAALADYLAGLDRPCFTLAAYLRKEAGNYQAWLLGDPAEVEARLNLVYGQATLRPAIDKLTTLAPADKTARLKAWLEEYGREMAGLCERVAQPHGRAVRAIEAVDERVADLAGDPSGEGVNPLIPLLMQPFARTYEHFLAAEAAYTMMDIIVAAAVHSDFTGRWPASLEELESFTGRSFPLDPFTGKPHRYRLRGELPEVSARFPGWLERQTRLPEVLGLRDRIERDAGNLERFAQAVQAERVRSALSAGDDGEAVRRK
jgi:hypothetical protein